MLESKNSTKEYFICLLPDLPNFFHQKLSHPLFQSLCPRVSFPFHVTLYFLDALSEEQLNFAKAWIEKNGATQKAIKTRVNSVNFFKKDDKNLVYFLDINSNEIDRLHQDLYKNFHRVHEDTFNFKQHMTLFYPTKIITSYQEKELCNLFYDIQELKFNKLALGSVIDEVIQIDHFVNLKV